MRSCFFLKSVGWSLIGSVVLTAATSFVFFMRLPDVKTLNGCLVTSLFQVDLCSKNQQYVALSDISPFVIDAVIVAEDGAFFQHNGFDWYEIKQSFLENWTSQSFVRGGSTITQQLVKNVFLTSEKTFIRKLKEAVLTWQVEQQFSKSFILEKYLNVVEFGENIYGVKAAARFYFKKNPRELQPLEASFLAFLLPSPRKYSSSHRQGQLTPFAKKMVKTLLLRMKARARITDFAFEKAMSQLDDFPWSSIQKSDFDL